MQFLPHTEKHLKINLNMRLKEQSYYSVTVMEGEKQEEAMEHICTYKTVYIISQPMETRSTHLTREMTGAN